MIARINWYGIAAAAGLLVLWQVAVESGAITADYIVAPTEILTAFSDLAASGELQENAAHTAAAVLAGWGIALVLGIGLGTVLGLIAGARTYGLASVDLLRSLPTIALVPPAVLVFGFSLQMEIFVVAYASLWPIVINTMGGIMRVPRELRDVAKSFRLSGVKTAASVVVPAAAPSILVGARLGLATAVILAVVAEMVGNPNGLGYAMVFAQNALNPAAMFAYIVTIGLLGLLLDGALMLATRFLRPVAAAKRQAEGPG